MTCMYGFEHMNWSGKIELSQGILFCYLCGNPEFTHNGWEKAEFIFEKCDFFIGLMYTDVSFHIFCLMICSVQSISFSLQIDLSWNLSINRIGIKTGLCRQETTIRRCCYAQVWLYLSIWLYSCTFCIVLFFLYGN